MQEKGFRVSGSDEVVSADVDLFGRAKDQVMSGY
jgi:hypothetical protein